MSDKKLVMAKIFPEQHYQYITLIKHVFMSLAISEWLLVGSISGQTDLLDICGRLHVYMGKYFHCKLFS